MAEIKETDIRRGTDNVFADLGRTDAATHKLKAELAQKIRVTLNERNLTQTAAAKLMGISQPEISRLLKGQFREISSDRLMRLLTRLELEIDIVVRRPGEAVGETYHLEAYA